MRIFWSFIKYVVFLLKRVALFIVLSYNIVMIHFYFDPAWLSERHNKAPATVGEWLIIVVAVAIMIGVTVFFFSWLGHWAWIFMWPWLVILEIVADLL